MIQTRIYLINGDMIPVRHSPEEVADRIDIAKLNGKTTVRFCGRGDKEVGFMVDQIVRWEGTR